MIKCWGADIFLCVNIKDQTNPLNLIHTVGIGHHKSQIQQGYRKELLYTLAQRQGIISSLGLNPITKVGLHHHIASATSKNQL